MVFRDTTGKNPLFWGTLVTVGLIIVLGYVNLLNADYYSQSSLHQRQALWIVFGLIVMGMAMFFDLRLVEAFSEIFYWVVIVLLVLVLIVGKEINHSRRWLFLWGFAIEPSEFAKPAVILVVSKYLHYAQRTGEHTLKSLLRPMGYVLLPAFLIMMEPDLGTGIIIILFSFTLFIIDGMSLKSLGILTVIVILLIPIAWYSGLIRPYQKQRLKVWLHLEDKNPKKMKGRLQPSQAVWAVGSGQLTGKGGRRASQSRLKYLPEMHTDFVFAIYAEERGFLGSVFLIGLYALLALLLLMGTMRAKEKFGALICLGASAYVFWQTFINIGMVTGLLPVVGLTLPLFSYGGSSLVSTLLTIGLALNVILFGSKRV